jgi:hypothetical protein
MKWSARAVVPVAVFAFTALACAIKVGLALTAAVTP